MKNVLIKCHTIFIDSVPYVNTNTFRNWLQKKTTQYGLTLTAWFFELAGALCKTSCKASAHLSVCTVKESFYI